MPFTKPVPADGTVLDNQGKIWTPDSGKWSERISFFSQVASSGKWGWVKIPSASSFITIDLAFNLDANGDLGFIAHDGVNTMEFQPSRVIADSRGYATICWGAGTQQIQDWNGDHAFSRTHGVPLHRHVGTQHVKAHNYGAIEIELMNYGVNTMMSWKSQYQSEDNSEILTLGNVLLTKAIGQFRFVGVNSTTEMNLRSIQVTSQ